MRVGRRLATFARLVAALITTAIARRVGATIIAKLVAAPAAMVLASLLVSQVAAAQAPPQISASLDPGEVSVGEPFMIELTALGDGSGPAPSEPALVLPPGLSAGGPSVGSQTQISFNNGRLSRHSGITASWRVVAAREGTFNIAGPTVSVGGQRFSANALRVVVRAGPPAGSPRSRRSRGANPFDPFGMMPPGFFDEPRVRMAPSPPPSPDLALDGPADPSVFLRAVTDRTAVAVGEQVTLTVYLYTLTPPNESESHDPPLADFLQRDLTTPTDSNDFKTAIVGGATWRVFTLRRIALFPLKTGDLEIGPARATFRDGGGNRSVERASAPIVLHVEDPPLAGRPAGYGLGNVGQFSLTASVEPRTAEVGGAIAVTVTVKGVGNLPTSLAVPGTSSVEWLDPQVREAIDADANGRVQGTRTFAYLVRPKRAGSIDIGAIALPYWDPAQRSYFTARAELGSVQVTPGAVAQTPVAAEAKDPFAGLGPVRTRLASVASMPRPLADRPLYWGILFGAPLAVIAMSLLRRGVSALQRRLGERRTRPSLAVDRALADARQAMTGGDAAGLAAALERAVHTAIEASTTLRTRALLLDELSPALLARGVDGELADRVRALISALEALRFSPDGASAVAALAPLVRTAESIVHDFKRASGRRS